MLQSLRLNDPCNVATDSTGNVYITDYYNNVIREVIMDSTGLVVNQVSNVNSRSVSIFPNPLPAVAGALHINGMAAQSSYSLVNALGSQMQCGNLAQGNNNIPVPSLPPGVYLLEITGSNGQKTTTKVVKQ